MLSLFIIILWLLAPFIIPCYLFLREPRNMLKEIVSISALHISVIQLLWAVGYMLEIYISIEVYSYILYYIALCWMISIMYRGPIKIGAWLAINVIVSLTVCIIWINIDDSPFRHGFMASLGMIGVPLMIVVLSAYLQVVIWWLLKLAKWVSSTKKSKRVPLNHSVIKYLKILVFQVILSVLLESAFNLYTELLSNIGIILALFITFIVRDKIRENYIFWITSWLGISCLIFVLGANYFWDFWGSNNQITSDGKIHMYTIIGLAIYHLLLTIYFRVRAEDQMPEELE